MKRTMQVSLFVLAAISVGSAAGLTEYAFTTIQYPDSSVTITEIHSINDRGIVAGGACRLVYEPFWSFIYDGEHFTDIKIDVSSTAQGINNLNQVTGPYHDGEGRQFYVYDNGAISLNHNDPQAQGKQTAVGGINDTGVIAGHYYDGTDYHGFLYDGND